MYDSHLICYINALIQCGAGPGAGGGMGCVCRPGGVRVGRGSLGQRVNMVSIPPRWVPTLLSFEQCGFLVCDFNNMGHDSDT